LLFDTRLSEDSPTSEQVRNHVQEILALRTKGISSHCAIVIGPHAYQYGLARMSGTHAALQGMHLEIFTIIDEALRWLSNPSTRESGLK
jgi:hypothetical protein